MIFDAVGKTSAKQAKGVLTDGGRYVSTRTRRQETVEDLLTIRDMMETGAVRAVIDRSYPLEEIAEAYRYVEGGHKRGNVVIDVAPENRNGLARRSPARSSDEREGV